MLTFFVFPLHTDIFKIVSNTVHLLHHNLFFGQDLPLPLFPKGGIDCHDAGGHHNSEDGGA